MEMGRTDPSDAARAAHATGAYGWLPTSHIGGVGMMRTSAFHSRPAIPSRGRFGFTAWQEKHDPVRGWITPDVRTVQIDLLPFEPWRSLAAPDGERDWARAWPPYNPASEGWWAWLRDLPRGET
jgi:hypothetical protein